MTSLHGMIGIMALCCTAEGLSNPGINKRITIAIDSSEELLLKTHGFEGGIDFKGLSCYDFDVVIM